MFKIFKVEYLEDNKRSPGAFHTFDDVDKLSYMLAPGVYGVVETNPEKGHRLYCMLVVNSRGDVSKTFVGHDWTPWPTVVSLIFVY